MAVRPPEQYTKLEFIEQREEITNLFILAVGGPEDICWLGSGVVVL